MNFLSASRNCSKVLLFLALLLGRVTALKADLPVGQEPHYGVQSVKPPVVKPPISRLSLQQSLFSNGEESNDAVLGLDPSNNRPLPEKLASYIAHLLVLEDPEAALEQDHRFAVNASVYASLLNLLATDADGYISNLLYTNKVAQYIQRDMKARYNFNQKPYRPYYYYYYSVKQGQEKVLLGYSKCLSAETFRDVLCQEQTERYTLDANVDSNQQSYLWLHFTTTFSSLAADLSETAYDHYQWIASDGLGKYYDFYRTQGQKSDGSFDYSLTGNIWVGVASDSDPPHDWTVTGGADSGLTTFTDGGAGVLVVPPVLVSEQPDPISEPPQPQQRGGKLMTVWDQFLQLRSQAKPLKTVWDQFLEWRAQQAAPSE
jgi:hypothetical protein